MKTTKLRDLAFELNLSVSTVSRALSGHGRVSRGTRERVLRAVETSQYTPNDVARSLRTRSMNNVGIIVTDITNSFFSSVIKGAQGVCRDRGFSVLLSNSDESPAAEEEAMRLMLEKQIAGLILATVGGGGDAIARYAKVGVPIVFIDNRPAIEGPYDFVSTDNFRAASALTKMLIDRGYTDIGIITGPLSQSSGLDRLEGFRSAMRERGLKPRPEWILEGDFRMEGGTLRMAELLKRRPMPRAVVVSNNYMAFGAIKAIKAAGKSIPGDVAVASFDVDDVTTLISPSIASMNQVPEAIGRDAAGMLIARVRGEETAPGRSIVLEPVLLDGASW